MEEQNIADKRLEEANIILDKYINGFGINIQANNDDISFYFNLSADQLRQMSAEECDIAAMLLSQKSTQIQAEINKHNRTKNWANENINAFIANKIANDTNQFVKYEAKRIALIQQNEYTNKLYQILRTASMHLDALEYLPISIKNHADLFISLAKSKRTRG